MKKEDQILINQYGQGIIDYFPILENFIPSKLDEKRKFLRILVEYFIDQSNPYNNDIGVAINESGLKPTHTPCVMLTKGIEKYNLLKIVQLPENELQKVLILFLSLFRIAYMRRFKEEKDHPNKWWYWDLSDQKNIELILNQI